MQVFRNIFVFYGKNPRRGSMGRIQILQLLSCRGQRGPQKSQREHILFINNEFMANFFPRGTEKIEFSGFLGPHAQDLGFLDPEKCASCSRAQDLRNGENPVSLGAILFEKKIRSAHRPIFYYISAGHWLGLWSFAFRWCP